MTGGGGGGGGGAGMTQYNNTTLFHYARHTQQKLVSRWGVGKHVTIKYIYIYLK